MTDKISEFTYRPKANKKPAIALFGTLLAICASLVIYSMLTLRYRGVIGLVAVVFLCWALYVYARYIGAEYAYAVVIDSEDTAQLIITKIIGKRVTTLASFPLYSIVCICTKTDAPTSDKETVHKYNYSVTLGQAPTYVITTRDRYHSCRITLECVAEVAARLSDYAVIARAKHLESEE